MNSNQVDAIDPLYKLLDYKCTKFEQRTKHFSKVVTLILKKLGSHSNYFNAIVKFPFCHSSLKFCENSCISSWLSQNQHLWTVPVGFPSPSQHCNNPFQYSQWPSNRLLTFINSYHPWSDCSFRSRFHSNLLHRLASSGLSGNPLEWFTSHLSSHHHFIQLKTVTCQPSPMSSGVTHSSVLSSMLFTIHLHSVGRLFYKYSIHFHCCAVDTQLYRSAEKLGDVLDGTH